MRQRHQEYNFQNKEIKKIIPEKNQVKTTDGTIFEYEYLIIGTGTHKDLSKIKGAKEAVEDENCPVSTNYALDLSVKTNKIRENFKGGKFLFTAPSTTIKCGGAPLKIMFLCANHF